MTASGGKWAESSETMSVFIAGDHKGLLRERVYIPPPVDSQLVKLIQRSRFRQHNELVGSDERVR